MVESRRLIVLGNSQSANLGHVKISLTHANQKKDTKVRSSKRSKNAKGLTKSERNASDSFGTASASTASSSTGAAASSLTGGDACGWII